MFFLCYKLKIISSNVELTDVSFIRTKKGIDLFLVASNEMNFLSVYVDKLSDKRLISHKNTLSQK